MGNALREACCAAEDRFTNDVFSKPAKVLTFSSKDNKKTAFGRPGFSVNSQRNCCCFIEGNIRPIIGGRKIENVSKQNFRKQKLAVLRLR
jgi:hypothetical protein